MTIHDSVTEYFYAPFIETLNRAPKFNFSDDSPDSIGIMPSYGETVVKRFINGDCLKEYPFSIVITRDYSTGQDEVNLEAMNMCQSIMQWIDKQNEQKNFPVFPDNCIVESIENMQNLPNISNVSEGKSARYVIQIKITYKEVC